MKTNATDPLYSSTSEYDGIHNGLTKREYFAGLALQGLLASNGTCYTTDEITDAAVRAADSIISALNVTLGEWEKIPRL